MKLRLSLSDMQDTIPLGQAYHVDAMLETARKELNAGRAVEVVNEIDGATISITTKQELERFISQIKSIKLA